MTKAMKPVIFALAGPALSADERALFRAARPAGYILFKRNIVDPAQVRALTDDLRELDGRANLPVLIDQEGGRVSRMQPPAWPAFPAGAPFGELYDVSPIAAIEAVRSNAQALALMLREAGINVDCLPLLDVRQEGAHDIIGDRAFGTDPLRVAALGRAVIEGLRAGGCVGVMKHMPGHGRATADSHKALPVVEASAAELELDLAPFRRLKDAPMGMTAHVVYTAWDAERPASLSPVVIEEVIRGKIGFDGFLMSDDIDMKALSGTPAEKAAGVVAAGCDVALDCWARFDEMAAIAEALDDMADDSVARLERAMATIGAPTGDFAGLVGKRDALLGYA